MDKKDPAAELSLDRPEMAAAGPRLGRASGPRHAVQVKRKGVLPRRAVRTAAFGIISLAIFACGALCLLAVWDYTTGGVPWRAITSLGIVAGTMGAFAVANDFFGEAERRDLAEA